MIVHVGERFSPNPLTDSDGKLPHKPWALFLSPDALFGEIFDKIERFTDSNEGGRCSRRIALRLVVGRPWQLFKHFLQDDAVNQGQTIGEIAEDFDGQGELFVQYVYQCVPRDGQDFDIGQGFDAYWGHRWLEESAHVHDRSGAGVIDPQRRAEALA